MNSLYLYHFKSYCLSFLTILSLFLVLFIIAQSASFLTLAIEGGLSALAFIQFLIHKVPVQIVDLAPICVIAAVAATSSQLTSAGEISVLRAAGVSDTSFFRPALLFGLSLACVYSIVTLDLAPRSSTALERLEARSLEQAASNVLVTPGEPTRIGNIELIAQNVTDFELRDVSLFGTSDTQLNVFVSAESASFITSNTGLSLKLSSGRILRDQVTPLDVQEFETVLIDLTALTTSAPNIDGASDEESLRLGDLLDPTGKTLREQSDHAEEVASRFSLIAVVFAAPTWILFWGLAFGRQRSAGSWLAHVGTVSAFILLILLESSKASFSTTYTALGLVLLFVVSLGVFGPAVYSILNLLDQRQGALKP